MSSHGNVPAAVVHAPDTEVVSNQPHPSFYASQTTPRSLQTIDIPAPSYLATSLQAIPTALEQAQARWKMFFSSPSPDKHNHTLIRQTTPSHLIEHEDQCSKGGYHL